MPLTRKEMIRGRASLQYLILKAINQSLLSDVNNSFPRPEDIFNAVKGFFPKSVGLDIGIVKLEIAELVRSGDVLDYDLENQPCTYGLTDKGRERLLESFGAQIPVEGKLESMPDVADALGDGWNTPLILLLILYEKNDFLDLRVIYQLSQKITDDTFSPSNISHAKAKLDELVDNGVVEKMGDSYKLTQEGRVLVEALSLLQHRFNERRRAERETALASS